DIKASRGNWDASGRFAGKGPVTRKDITYVRAENAINHGADHTISKNVKVPEGLILVLNEPSGGGHIGIALEDRFQQQRDRVRIVGIVSIHHDENVRVDLIKHGGDNPTFALALFSANNCAGLPGNPGGCVRAVVVINVNFGLGKNASE